jgi:uncharacterized protein
MNLTANARFQKIAEYIQMKIADAAPATGVGGDSYAYRWQHTLRVAQYGHQLALAEGANQELCVTACLLHDLAKFENRDHGIEHGRVGARLARPLLQSLGYAPYEIENICFSIAVHVDDQADFEHPITLESKVVNDADNIDRFSAYRVLINLDRNRMDYENLVKNAEKRLMTLSKYRQESIMATPSGNLLFNKQLDLQIMFMERLIAESKLTHLPKI